MVRVVIIEEDGCPPFRVEDIDPNDVRGIIGDWPDHTSRYIGCSKYNILCDDCGLIKHRAPTAFTEDGPLLKVALVGTLIITTMDDDWRDLSEEHILEITSNIIRVTDTEGNTMWGVLIS